MSSKILIDVSSSPKPMQFAHAFSGGDDSSIDTKTASNNQSHSFYHSIQASLFQTGEWVATQIRPFVSTPQTWHLRVIEKLNVNETKLDIWFKGKYSAWDQRQSQIDQLGERIKKAFSFVAVYNEWLRDETPQASPLLELSMYLIKLPLRSIQNILDLFYNVMKEILYIFVHPINAMFQISRQIIAFLYGLTLPETWSKIGMGMIGAELCQVVILANPVFQFSIIVGITLLFLGLGIGALKAAIINVGKEREAARENLFMQVKGLPEDFLTSFFMGIVVGNIQKKVVPRVSASEQTKNLASKYVQKHNLTSNSKNPAHQAGKNSHFLN